MYAREYENRAGLFIYSYDFRLYFRLKTEVNQQIN